MKQSLKDTKTHSVKNYILILTIAAMITLTGCSTTEKEKRDRFCQENNFDSSMDDNCVIEVNTFDIDGNPIIMQDKCRSFDKKGGKYVFIDSIRGCSE